MYSEKTVKPFFKFFNINLTKKIPRHKPGDFGLYQQSLLHTPNNNIFSPQNQKRLTTIFGKSFTNNRTIFVH